MFGDIDGCIFVDMLLFLSLNWDFLCFEVLKINKGRYVMIFLKYVLIV